MSPAECDRVSAKTWYSVQNLLSLGKEKKKLPSAHKPTRQWPFVDADASQQQILASHCPKYKNWQIANPSTTRSVAIERTILPQLKLGSIMILPKCSLFSIVFGPRTYLN